MPLYQLLEGKNHTEWIPDKDKPDDPTAGTRVKLESGDKVRMTTKRAANLKDRFVLMEPQQTRTKKDVAPTK